MTTLTPTTLAAALPAIEALAELRRLRPSLWYDPHPYGQLQFHKSTHIIRGMFPGNGWGKTTACGVEMNWWLQHSHPYQRTPEWPIVALWFCPQRAQFEILRAQLETECLDRGWKWNDQKHRYTWPNGSVLYTFSCDDPGVWEDVQGINPDLVNFDEEPPLSVWREMMMRRRGKRDTRYMVGATATKGVSWMEDVIYRPWADHHTAQGFAPGEGGKAVEVQNHPTIWCWDHGGIAQNPGAKAEQVKWYESQQWRNEAERLVRLRGGFRRFTGNSVFAYDAMERLRAVAAEWDAKTGTGKTGSVGVKEAV